MIDNYYDCIIILSKLGVYSFLRTHSYNHNEFIGRKKCTIIIPFMVYSRRFSVKGNNFFRNFDQILITWKAACNK